MNKQSKLEALVALTSGVLFGVGLPIAGMTQPSKVVSFLDFTGDWDPSLAFVMIGAIAVYVVANRLVAKRASPLVGAKFHLPTRRDLDPRLVFGAALFGVGWGLGGYCPGPGLASLATGTVAPLLFVGMMAIGMFGFDALEKARAARREKAASTAASPS